MTKWLSHPFSPLQSVHPIKKLLLAFAVLMLMHSGVFAQKSLTGVVTDTTGAPITGVNVTLKGTRTSTQTNAEGKFILSAATISSSDMLIFSLVGHEVKELTIGNATQFNLSLLPLPTLIGEVVVIGYGTQKKSSLTGAINTIGADELEGKAVPNVTQALQGVSPNLIIQQNATEPGASLNVNIRGVSTLGNASALVVIDGIPGSLNSLNPSDIESISILKDAASAAIYGSRAANGVILVTTKKGKRNAKPQVAYSGLIGVQSPLYTVKPVSAYEFAVLKNEALINSGMQPVYSPEQIKEIHDQGSYPSWLDEIIQKNALQHNHNLSVNGGSGNTNYLFSVGYVDQQSLYTGNDEYGLKRYNIRANINSQIGTRLKVGSMIGLSRTAIKEHAYFSEWLISTASRIPRLYPIKDSAGRYFIAPTAANNPLAQLEQGGMRQYQNDNLNFNVNAELSIVKGLSAKLVYGGDLGKNVLNEFRKSIDYAPYVGGDNQSAFTDALTNISLTNLQAMLNYETLLDRHAVKALVGYSTENYSISSFQLQRLNVDNTTGQPITGTTINENSSYNKRTDRWALNSMFGRLNYSFNDRYLFEFNFRLDGSSRFAAGNRQAFFPSFSAGWKVTDEPFLQNFANNIGDVKIRGSWGQLGNQEIGLYRYLNVWSTNPNIYGFNNTGQAGSSFSVGNQDIQWETSSMVNIGADATLLNRKLTISWDYFVNNTSGILMNLPAPSLYGATAPVQNAGKVKNQGWELAVSYRITTGRFSHTFSGNVADNYNTVTDIGGQTFITEADRTFITKEGFPINSYYGLQSDGFYQSQSEINRSIVPSFVNSIKPGDIKYVDRNKDGKIDNNDRYLMGNPFPRYTFGFSYNVNWKGFDMSFLLQGVGKRSLYLRGEAVEAFHNNWDALYEQHLDRWTPTNPSATYPRLTIGSASTNNIVGSDFWLLNAAYLRLKNAQIGYTFDRNVLSRTGISKMRVYLTGQNLFTITKLNNGFDPEITELNNSLQISNSHSNSGRVYPNMRVLAVGLDVNF